MATTVKRLLTGLRRGIQDDFRKSGSYEVGDVLEFITDAINFASIADAESVTSAVTDATGVAIGDVVLGVAGMAVAADPIHTAGLVINGRVTDANEVSIDIQNDSGGALDPGSQTFRIIVLKAAV